MLRIWAESSLSAANWGEVTRLVVVLTAGLSACTGYSQTLIPELSPGGTMRLGQTDLAVLELKERRHDLPCTVSLIKPELDWDFTFHAGYQVEVPLLDL